MTTEDIKTALERLVCKQLGVDVVNFPLREDFDNVSHYVLNSCRCEIPTSVGNIYYIIDWGFGHKERIFIRNVSKLLTRIDKV